MSVEALVREQEYLETSYSPDREYRDGVLVERNVGDELHSWLQIALGAYLFQRREQWSIEVYPELRIKVREGWYPLPDLCLYPAPRIEERVPTRPPLLWIEIFSKDDRIVDVWNKARQLVKCGVPNVWVIDPETLDSELWTAEGKTTPGDKTLRIPGSPIVIPLIEVVKK